MKTKGLTLIMLLSLTISIFAQGSENRFGVELNSGVSFATKKMDGADLKPGFGFEGTLHYRFLHELETYGGCGWIRFDSPIDKDSNGLVIADISRSFERLYMAGFIGLSEGSVDVELLNPIGVAVCSSTVNAPIEMKINETFAALPGYWKFRYIAISHSGGFFHSLPG